MRLHQNVLGTGASLPRFVGRSNSTRTAAREGGGDLDLRHPREDKVNAWSLLWL